MTPTLVHTTVTSSGAVMPLLGGAVLVLVAMSVVIVAPRGEYRVVARRGRVRRVVESGPGWRIPGLDTVLALPATEHDQQLMVHATTGDGEDVVVLADATVRFQPPVVGRPCVDPWSTAERTAEEAVRAGVANLPLAGLGPALRAAGRELEADVRARLAVGGVVLANLDIVEIDLPLSGGRPHLDR